MTWMQSRNSAIGIATACGPDGGGVGVWVQVGAGFFSHPSRPDRFRGSTASYQMSTWGYFSGVKRLGREADLSPPTSDEVMNKRIYTPVPPYTFMA
jgi:hypothetical protein